MSLKNGGGSLYLRSLGTSLSCSCVAPAPVVVAPAVSAVAGSLFAHVVACADADTGLLTCRGSLACGLLLLHLL